VLNVILIIIVLFISCLVLFSSSSKICFSTEILSHWKWVHFWLNISMIG